MRKTSYTKFRKSEQEVMKMAFDYRKLRGKIKEIYNVQSAFAAQLGISCTSLSNKLNGIVDFSQEEIAKSVELLEIEKQDIPLYFFVEKV